MTPIYPTRTHDRRVPLPQVFPPRRTVASDLAGTLGLGGGGGGNALLTDLISYWKLDEASGTRVDSHGSNDLSDNNTAGSATGKINNAASFVAANAEYLSSTSNASLQMSGNTDFTIAYWVKLASLPSSGTGWSLITKDDDAASSRDYTLDLFSGTEGFRFYIQGGATYLVRVNSAPSTGTWHFVVAWYDSSNGQLHLRINDTTTYDSTSTGATGTDVSAAEFRIGAREYAGFEDYADAIIDEVSLWKRLLTAQEITDLYNSGAGLSYDSFGGGGVKLTKLALKSITATLATAGAITKTVAAAVSAALTFAGNLTKQATKATEGTLSFSGALATVVAIIKNLAGTLSFSGTVGRLCQTLLSGTLSFSGTIAKTVAAAVSAALSFTGSVGRLCQTLMTGTLSFSGALATIVAVIKNLAGALGFAGGLLKQVTKATTGTLSFTGAITKAVAAAVSAALTFAGNLTKQATKATEGTLSFSGALSTLVAVVKNLVGALGFAGGALRQANKSTGGALSFTGALTRLVQKTVSGILSFAGALTRDVIGGFEQFVVYAHQKLGSILNVLRAGSTVKTQETGSTLDVENTE